MLFKNIETERLLLKNISIDDREFIFSQFSNDKVNQYLFDAEPLTEPQEADEIIAFYLQAEPRLQHRWVLIRKSDERKMGTCGFHCWNRSEGTVEVGYDLQEEFWGKGYMREAMKAILKFAGDEMKVKEIIACIYMENQRSIHLAEKLGFTVSGSRYELFRGQEYLHHQYSLKLANPE